MASWAKWEDVPVGEQNVINSLIDQWEQLAGYTVKDIPPWSKVEMANQQLSSTFQLGQYMWGKIGNDSTHYINSSLLTSVPWAKFGMTSDAFQSTLVSYQAEMQQLIGNAGEWQHFLSMLGGMGGQINAANLRQTVMADPELMKSYGWLKYGMDHDQFRAQKSQMRQFFGQDISDEEAIKQLQYLHAGVSPQHAASSQPTLTQVEKKQANVGAGQSVVR